MHTSMLTSWLLEGGQPPRQLKQQWNKTSHLNQYQFDPQGTGFEQAT
jgi:hypothetical protein